jgi:hypothetical protein
VEINEYNLSFEAGTKSFVFGSTYPYSKIPGAVLIRV